MALRIAVNAELEHLQDALASVVRRLKPGGRIAVITFNSNEDRICKETFVDLSGKCRCPRNFPVCVCGADKKIHIVTDKIITATAGEVLSNARSRGAKLRIAERI